MTNFICNCPVTIQGFLETRSELVGERLNMDPSLVPALIRNLRIAGMSKLGIAKQFRLRMAARHAMRPIVTETRPASKWVACRTGHIAPLLAHAEVCQHGTTPERVIAAFWNHGKAVARKKDPNAVAPSDTLVRRLVSAANRYDLDGVAAGFKIAQRFNRVR